MKIVGVHHLILTASFLCATAAWSEGNQFKALPDTASPDGAFVFGYGPVATAETLGAFTEAAGDKLSIPRSYQPNYLVDARTRRIAAAIPMLHDMELNLTSPHSSFHVAWWSRGSAALAIFNGRYTTDTVMWIEPATKTFSDVTDALKAPVSKIVLERNGEKLAEMLSSIWLSNGVFHEPGQLTLRASAADLGGGGSGLTYEYALKFQMKPAGGKMFFELLKSAVVVEGEIPDSELESGITAAFNNLRNAMDQSRRETLQMEHLEWLKKRKGISNEPDRNHATLLRIKELRARLVEP